MRGYALFSYTFSWGLIMSSFPYTGGLAAEMTLRDYFAAEAMKVVLIDSDYELTAVEAYKIADWMIKQKDRV